MGIKKPIEIRLIERLEFMKRKNEEKRRQLEFSFTPTIDANSRKILKRKTEGNVFNRLFSLSVDAHSLPLNSPKFGKKQSRSFCLSKTSRDDTQKSIDITFSE